MSVLMMDVREMRMPVLEWFMLMEMHMRLAAIPVEIMRMLMMLVMRVRMFMCHRFMRVLMLMVFCQMQPHAKRHERTRPPETEADRFAHE